MTVSNSTSKIVYTVSLAVDGYAFPFKVLNQEHLLVAGIDPATGGQTTLILNSDYTVAGVGDDDGGQITMTETGKAKIRDGWNLVIVRRMPFVQQIDYRPYDLFPAETHERALDILTMQDQELLALISRAILAPLDNENPPDYSEFLDKYAEAIDAAQAAGKAADEAEEAALAALAEAQKAAQSAQEAADIANVGPATASKLGLVKVGENLSIDENGVLSATAEPYDLPIATVTTLGGVKQGANINISPDGTINGTAFTLPIATALVLGGIKAGAGLSVDAGGVASVTGGAASNAIITASGTHTVKEAGWYAISIWGGGGGGASGTGGDGKVGYGGAGGYIRFYIQIVANSVFTCVIGAGGAGGYGVQAKAGGFTSISNPTYFPQAAHVLGGGAGASTIAGESAAIPAGWVAAHGSGGGTASTGIGGASGTNTGGTGTTTAAGSGEGHWAGIKHATQPSLALPGGGAGFGRGGGSTTFGAYPMAQPGQPGAVIFEYIKGV